MRMATREDVMPLPVSLLARLTAIALGIAVIGAAAAEARTRLTVYTATETDQLAALKAAIEKDLPDLDVTWVRDSTGVITARLLAERDRPRADLVFGIVTSSLSLFKQLNMIEPYQPKGADALKPAFRDPSPPYGWTGIDAFVLALCFNTAEAARSATPRPRVWSDLIHPAYRGHIAMPHPASSGTGFLLVATWIQMMGEEAAWRFMEELDRNVVSYTHSGSAPCVQASRGERVLGLSFDMRATREKALGAPIDIIIPADGTGWEMGAMAVMRGRPLEQTEAAKRLADWATTPSAHELFAKFYGIVALPGVPQPPNYPPEAETLMTPVDVTWMSANRDRILGEWSRRFEQAGRRP
jgi:iron(III) transport system substrate-binding protein